MDFIQEQPVADLKKVRSDLLEETFKNILQYRAIPSFSSERREAPECHNNLAHPNRQVSAQRLIYVLQETETPVHMKPGGFQDSPCPPDCNLRCDKRGELLKI